MNRPSAAAKPTVGEQTFDNWKDAVAHAAQLEMHGKISRRELNDVKSEARQAGFKSNQETKSKKGPAPTPKPAVSEKTWEDVIALAGQLEMSGKISRRELNDVKTVARQAGFTSSENQK